MGLFAGLAKISLLGIGASIVGPRILTRPSKKGVRPLVKEAVKGGILAYDEITQKVGEIGRHMQDLVDEVKQEMQNGMTEDEHVNETMKASPSGNGKKARKKNGKPSQTNKPRKGI
jgi:hypothetical protein